MVFESYTEMCNKAADIVAEQITLKSHSVLGLPTGLTPVKMYEILIEKNKNGEIDFSDVKTFNLDEYYPVSPIDKHSYRYFMNETFFKKINIKMENTCILNGQAEDAEKECDMYQKLIEKSGGIDLLILGIGRNGHIGFNEPDEYLLSYTHKTRLLQETIEVNSKLFDDVSEVPEYALTMGIGTIMQAKRIILLASGKSKYKALRELMAGKITTLNPSTLLNVHPCVTVLCDRDAYEGGKEK